MNQLLRYKSRSVDFSEIFDFFFVHRFDAMEDGKHVIVECSSSENNLNRSDDGSSSYYSENGSEFYTEVHQKKQNRDYTSTFVRRSSSSSDKNNNQEQIIISPRTGKIVDGSMESASVIYKSSAVILNTDDKGGTLRLSTIKSDTEDDTQKVVLKDTVVVKKPLCIAILIIVILIIIAQFVIALVVLFVYKTDNSFINNVSQKDLSLQSEWMSWGDCNVPCGGGFRSRIKKCNQRPCTENMYETAKCNTRPCGRGTCCSSITVDFGGPAFQNQSALRGNYMYLNSSFRTGDVFINKIGSGRYLYKSNSGSWGIGVSTLDQAFGIYHKDCSEQCPTECSHDWRYFNQQDFKVDKLIRVTCEQRDCCAILELRARGEAKKQWPGCFGYYHYVNKDIHGSPIYAHFESNMFLIRDHGQNTWKVADGHGHSKSHYISRYYRDGYFCPEDAITGNWRYFNNNLGEWSIDSSINLVCAEVG